MSRAKSIINRLFFSKGPVVTNIIRCFSMDLLLSIIRGCSCIGYRSKYAIVDLHFFRRILSLIQSFCDHHRHMVSNIIYLPLSECGVRWSFMRFAIIPCDINPTNKRSYPVCRQIVASKNCNNSIG